MKTCLIVDDSRIVRKVTRRVVEGLNFSCIEAPNGHEAFALCEKDMPDVVLLDWNMPIMSGIEFLEKLREIDTEHKARVIFCTTENDARHVQRAMDAGADEYIMKPFDSDIIKSKFTSLGLMS